MKEEFTTNTRRWYDKDPVLSSAMKTLEESDDETQIKVALNLIKIITEHHLSSTEYESVEDIVSATEDVMDESKNGRWYDLDGTLRTAISLLTIPASYWQTYTQRITTIVTKFSQLIPIWFTALPISSHTISRRTENSMEVFLFPMNSSKYLR